MALTPQYMKVREYVIGLIGSAEPGKLTRIESEAKLCELFNVSRVTVRGALRQLVEDGYLITRRKVGTFINPEKIPHGVRTPMVGIFFGDGMQVNRYYNPAFNALMASVGELGMGHRLLHSPERLNSPRDYFRTLSAQLAAIVWFWPSAGLLELLRESANADLPAICVRNSYHLNPADMDSVVTDNYGLGRKLFALMAENDHDKVLHVALAISGHNVEPGTTLAGYRDAAMEAGKPFYPELGLGIETLDETLPPIMERRAFTAIYSSNDAAPFILSKAREKNLSVPDDFSYVTYNACSPCLFDGLKSDHIKFSELSYKKAFSNWLIKRVLERNSDGVIQRQIAPVIVKGKTLISRSEHRQPISIEV